MSDLVPIANEPAEEAPNPEASKKRKPWFRIILIIILLVLFISPFDLNPVPDAVPIVGWLDEVVYVIGIITTVITMFSKKGKKDQ